MDRSFRFGLFSLALVAGLAIITGLTLAQPPGLFEFPISTAPNDQMRPAISGDVVVWQDGRDGNSDIYGSNLSAHNEFTVCTATNDQQAPAICGDIVVWHDERSGKADIYGYDLNLGQEFTVCTEAADQFQPDVSGDLVVWHDYRNQSVSNRDIYGYNLGTGQEFTVCTNVFTQTYPAIDGNVVVWYDTRNEPYGDIYGRDLSNSQEFSICTVVGNQYYVDISGDIVVWQDGRKGYEWDIYGYNLSISQELTICLKSGNQMHPAIEGDLVVWQDDRSGNADIYGYSLSTGQEFPICTDDAGQDWPAFYGNVVVWEDERNGPLDIYGARLALSSSKAVDKSAVRPGQGLTYTIVLSNASPIPAFNTHLTDTLPANTTYVTGSLAASQGVAEVAGRELRWQGVISRGQAVTITFQVMVADTVHAGYLITNAAQINDGYLTPFWSNETRTTVLAPQLNISKDAPPWVFAGELLTYTIVVSETGSQAQGWTRPGQVAGRQTLPPVPTVITDVMVTDTVPASTTCCITVSHGGALVGNDVVWTGQTISQGSSISLTFVVTAGQVPTGTIITNDAYRVVTSTQGLTTGLGNAVNTVVFVPVEDVYLPAVLKNYAPFCNGDFEQGSLCWSFGGIERHTVTTTVPHSGNYSALLGGDTSVYRCDGGVPIGSAWMEQTFNVPATGNPSLSLWYRLYSHDKTKERVSVDSFEVKIDGMTVFDDILTWAAVADCNTPPNDRGWQQSSTIDLSAYKGKTIILRFEVWNRLDNWYNTWAYIDDVSLQY